MSDPIAPGSPAATGDPGGPAGLPAPSTSVPEAGITHSGAPRNTQPGGLSQSRGASRRGDRIFACLATGSGAFVVLVIGAIGIFLLLQAIPALAADKENFFSFREYLTDNPNNLRFGILDLLEVTVEVSIFALILAMPIGLGIALYLTQYAPARLARPFAYLVDLLAAVPSIIFGLWGILVLAPVINPFAVWLNAHLGWIWLFAHGNVGPELGSNLFTAGIVLAAMLLPIITAISREVFSRTPRPLIEGALALGATKWEVIRTTVLPFGKAGYISASMLGLGRALGETIALLVILSSSNRAFGGSLFDGGYTFASKIASSFAELNNPLAAGAYIAAGLVLFVFTFAVNAAARWIINRGVPQA